MLTMPLVNPLIQTIMEPVAHVQVGTAQTPLILLGATADVPITWPDPLPDANYKLSIAPATGLIGKATVALKPNTKTATGITVTVTAGLAVALGSEIVAIAVC